MPDNESQPIYISHNINPDPSAKIHVRSYCAGTGQQYNVWNYDKDMICVDEPANITQCRSIIWSSPENALLSFSPGKSTPFNQFFSKYSENVSDVYVNEYIEGTMIHLFYDTRIKSWEIATSRAVGGMYQVSNHDEYDRKTFTRSRDYREFHIKTRKTVRKMFTDALREEHTPLSQIEMLRYFPTQYSYTFILKHPDSPIVFPVTEPALYLIAVYDINSKYRRAISIPPHVFQTWGFLQNTPIQFPKQHLICDLSDLNDMQLSDKHTPNFNSGYVATHLPTGNRCVFINQKYKDLLRLQRADPRFVYHYLALRKSDLIEQYVATFPRFRRMFHMFREHYTDFIDNLHTAYLVKYVWRKNVTVSDKYDKYIDAIHREIYIPSIRKSRVVITRKIVHDYMTNKPPGDIMYALYYEKRAIMRLDENPGEV